MDISISLWIKLYILFYLFIYRIRIPYQEQLTKKHKTGIAHLSKFKRRMTQLQDLNDTSKAQIAWAFEK